MAQIPPNSARLAVLVARSANARATLSRSVAAVRHRANLPARLRESFVAKPFAWFGGSLVVGLGAAWLFRRKSSTAARKSHRRLPGWLFNAITSSAKPFVKAWLIGQLKSRLQSIPQRNDNSAIR